MPPSTAFLVAGVLYSILLGAVGVCAFRIRRSNAEHQWKQRIRRHRIAARILFGFAIAVSAIVPLILEPMMRTMQRKALSPELLALHVSLIFLFDLCVILLNFVMDGLSARDSFFHRLIGWGCLVMGLLIVGTGIQLYRIVF